MEQVKVYYSILCIIKSILYTILALNFIAKIFILYKNLRKEVAE